MVYKLGTALGSSIAIAIFLLLTNTDAGSSTEYVFTAPPEVDRSVVEIPKRETEYPLYECEQESEDALDSHDCVCTDCEEVESNAQPEEVESDSEINPEINPGNEVEQQ